MNVLVSIVIAVIAFVLGFSLGTLFGLASEEDISRDAEEERIKEDTYE